jgi:hypothetical protein
MSATLFASNSPVWIIVSRSLRPSYLRLQLSQVRRARRAMRAHQALQEQQERRAQQEPKEIAGSVVSVVSAVIWEIRVTRAIAVIKEIVVNPVRADLLVLKALKVPPHNQSKPVLVASIRPPVVVTHPLISNNPL